MHIAAIVTRRNNVQGKRNTERTPNTTNRHLKRHQTRKERSKGNIRRRKGRAEYLIIIQIQYTSVASEYRYLTKQPPTRPLH